MADILKFVGFRGRQPAVTAPAGAFLSEASSIGATRTGAQNAMAHDAQDDCALLFGAGKAYAVSDWTNQELADLYRVEALLLQANIRIETARGVSDEGDPWFIFCHVDGEVFVHLARIDGTYVLDGPGLDTVLRGLSFAALIDRFASAVARRTAGGNIVQFRPGATDEVVRLHPAVMLAALIWSLYLTSDHFVGTAHAGEMVIDDGHAVAPTSLMQSSEMAREQVDKSLFDGPYRLVGREIELSRDGVCNGGVIPSWSMTGAATSIAAGLTAIAVSFGLYDRQFAGRAFDSASHEATEVPRIELDSAHTSAPMQGFSPIDTVSAESSKNGEVPWVTKVDPVAIVLQAVAYAQAALVHFDAVVNPEQVAHSQFLPGGIAAAQTEAANTQDTASTKLTAPDDAHDLTSLVTLATEHLGQISSYVFAGFNVDATFDVSMLSNQTTQIVLADLSEPPTRANIPPVGGMATDDAPHADTIAQYLPYDDAAKSFVYQFLVKSDSIEMIKSDNMVVFIDTTAIDDPSDHAYSVSWMSDDHFVVSTIGHAEDFAGLSLV